MTARRRIARRSLPLCEGAAAVLVPPFEHPDIIAGQGTAGLELAEEAAALGVLSTMCWCAARAAG
jgi:threonine dehydratase